MVEKTVQQSIYSDASFCLKKKKRKRKQKRPSVYVTYLMEGMLMTNALVTRTFSLRALALAAMDIFMKDSPYLSNFTVNTKAILPKTHTSSFVSFSYTFFSTSIYFYIFYTKVHMHHLAESAVCGSTTTQHVYNDALLIKGHDITQCST